MPNAMNSQNVRFNPVQGQVADFVLNHPTASPFKKNDISFHIGGQYLEDFSQKGIKDFVKGNDRKLSFEEVGAFIQSTATNAAELKGASFDLSDPELGLAKKDGINQKHIETGFVLETRSGQLPSQGVVFFDADAAKFPLKEAEVAVEDAKKEVKQAEKGFKKAEDKVDNAQYLRQRLVDFLGNDSPKDLAEYQSRVSDLETGVAELKTDKASYQAELSGLQASSPRATELKRVIRGVDLEISESTKTLDKAKENISSKQGPLSFMGIGNSLSELHERNTNLSSAQDTMQNARQQLDSARQKLTDAESLRARILSGKGIQQPAKPAEPVAPKPAEPTPAKPPVAQEPPAKPPVAPQPPVKPAPADDLVVIPNEPKPAPVAQKPPAQPPTPAPAQPPVAPPVAPPLSDDDNLYIIPGVGNSHNPVVIEGPGSQPAPVKPTPAQPAPVQPTQPAPAQPAPVQAPVATTPAKPVSSIGDGAVSKILYTVKRGDTLSSIAQTELGSWKRWPEIAKVNHDVIGTSNTHWIYPGQVLTMPPSQLRSAE